MCLAIPMKIREIHGQTAVAETGSLAREIRVDCMDDVKPGD